MIKDLKRIRKELGISQVRLAKEVGVSMMTVQLWERGGGKPNEENRKKLEGVIERLRAERG